MKGEQPGIVELAAVAAACVASAKIQRAYGRKLRQVLALHLLGI